MYKTVETDKTDAPLLAVLMVATTILTVLTILATIALFYWSQESISEQYADSEHTPGKLMLQEQGQRLEESVWRDKEAGKVSIPIETAKELVLKEGL